MRVPIMKDEDDFSHRKPLQANCYDHESEPEQRADALESREYVLYPITDQHVIAMKEMPIPARLYQPQCR